MLEQTIRCVATGILIISIINMIIILCRSKRRGELCDMDAFRLLSNGIITVLSSYVAIFYNM